MTKLEGELYVDFYDHIIDIDGESLWPVLERLSGKKVRIMIEEI